MEVLWKRSPLTASEVAKALPRSTKWALNTVRTLLTRLVDKGALFSQKNAEGVRDFTPAVQREACVREESRDFLDRVFRGAAKPLLLHFASHSKLTPDEVREIKRLLDESLKNKN